MNNTSKSILLLSLSAIAAFGFADPTSLAAQTEKIEPRIAKPGTVLTITGRSLDKTHVAEVFLTDHRFDMKVKVLEQSADHMLIRIPPFAKPGRLELLLLTAGASPVYLEQPLYIQVVGSDDELPAPPPVDISHHKKPKPTVEVASTGTSVPVPVNGTPPASPAVSAELEKSVVPLKPKKAVVETASAAPPPPAVPAPAPTPAPVVIPQAAPVQARPVEIPTPQQQRQPPPAQEEQQLSAPQPQAATPPKVPATTATKAPIAGESGSIPARIVQRTSVRFPPAAMSQHIEGSVELISIVRADGHVKDVKVLKGNPFLVQAAVSAVREWVYEPAYLHGKPIESEVSIVLNFKRPE